MSTEQECFEIAKGKNTEREEMFFELPKAIVEWVASSSKKRGEGEKETLVKTPKVSIRLKMSFKISFSWAADMCVQTRLYRSVAFSHDRRKP